MIKKSHIKESLEELKEITGLDFKLENSSDNINNDIIKLNNLISKLKNEYTVDNLIIKYLFSDIEFYNLVKDFKKIFFNLEIKFNPFLVNYSGNFDNILVDVLSNLFPDSNDYIINIGSNNILILNYNKNKHTKQVAKNIVDTLNTEAMYNSIVIYQDEYLKLEDIRKFYSNALFTLDLQKIFYSDKNILNSSSLNLEALFINTPLNLLKRYFYENTTKYTDFNLDTDSLNTLQAFINNNLNITETAKLLHLHRNTLNYRLEQIENKLGLDIRNFYGAMNFSILYPIYQLLTAKGEL